MIKDALKNFAKNGLYVFVPMGIFYLFLLITAFALVSAVGRDVGDVISRLTELISSSAEESSASVNDFVAYALDRIDWNAGLSDIIGQIISTNWLENTIKGFFETLNASSEGFGEQFAAIAEDFKSKLTADLSLAAAMCTLGAYIANSVTGILLRKRNARRNIKKFVLAHTLVPLAQTLILVVFFVLLAFIKLYSLIVAVALITLSGVLSLLSSWLVYGYDKLKISEVLTAQNVFGHLASVGIILLINAVVAVILAFINVVLLVLLMIPLVIYSFNAADLNADVFVCSLADARAAEPKTLA